MRSERNGTSTPYNTLGCRSRRPRAAAALRVARPVGRAPATAGTLGETSPTVGPPEDGCWILIPETRIGMPTHSPLHLHTPHQQIAFGRLSELGRPVPLYRRRRGGPTRAPECCSGRSIPH